MSTALENSEKITAKNAHRCTPYQLRQELLRRDALDLEEEKCNYNTMLQRLMIELVKEESTVQVMVDISLFYITNNDVQMRSCVRSDCHRCER
jgi:hypothetical protein